MLLVIIFFIRDSPEKFGLPIDGIEVRDKVEVEINEAIHGEGNNTTINEDDKIDDINRYKDDLKPE